MNQRYRYINNLPWKINSCCISVSGPLFSLSSSISRVVVLSPHIYIFIGISKGTSASFSPLPLPQPVHIKTVTHIGTKTCLQNCYQSNHQVHPQKDLPHPWQEVPARRFYTTMIEHIRGRLQNPVTVIASASIVSIILHGGHTAHYTFKIPIPVTDIMVCPPTRASIIGRSILEATVLF